MMLLQAQLHLIALTLSLTFVSADNSATNGTAASSNCVPFNVYKHPNASNFYPIPAVVQEPGASSEPSSSTFLVHSNEETWQIANTLSQGGGPSGNNIAELLENYLYLNISSGQNASILGSVLSGCSVIFNLPQTDLGQSSGNGDCTSLVGSACVDDITTQVQQLVSGFASNDAIQLQIGCESILQSLATLPNSCPKPTNKDDLGFRAFYSQGLNLTYQLNESCPSAPANFPLILHEQTAGFQQANYTVYDKWAKTTTPVLLTLFSNASTFDGSPFADTRLICTKPTNITPGSHNPNTSAASGFAKASRELVFVVGLATNALEFAKDYAPAKDTDEIIKERGPSIVIGNDNRMPTPTQ
ncbi:hypothetical protein OEA41_005089 [Lepraria neglecta]|uniref:Uncharacterized protein n=1 Tax=Lepraria neglecta TaxID=209136 RepID=A0AAE0DGD2_9LECA|nr:hypothetical protein OEA41_005089 [Lepraria neglecta]